MRRRKEFENSGSLIPINPYKRGKSILVRWITRNIFAGSPLTLALLKELVYLLYIQRVRHAFSGKPLILYLRFIGHKWIYRFLRRYSNIELIYSR